MDQNLLEPELRSCVKEEMGTLTSPSLIVRTISLDVKQHQKKKKKTSVSEFRSCVKVDVAVLGSLSLIVLMVSVDVKQH